MNKNAEIWVEALRSGNYNQGTGVLHYFTEEGDNYYCCLGVACKLYNKLSGDQVYTNIRDDNIVEYDDMRGILPDKVSGWLGLSTTEGGYDDGDMRTNLAERNDGGDTFEDIANLIESEPEGLFA